MDIDRRQMRQHQRPRQPFVTGLKVLSHNNDGHGGGDPLVTGARIAHRRQRCAPHPGIRGGAGANNNVRTQILRQPSARALLFKRCANVQPPLPAEPFAGERIIQLPCFQDEANGLKRHLLDKFQDLRQRSV